MGIVSYAVYTMQATLYYVDMLLELGPNPSPSSPIVYYKYTFDIHSYCMTDGSNTYGNDSSERSGDPLLT